MKNQTRIIELIVKRSKKNNKLGHVIANLHPCGHNRYLGLCIYKGEGLSYRTQVARIIRIEEYEVTEKEFCKLCPDDESWLTDLESELSPIEDIEELVDMDL